MPRNGSGVYSKPAGTTFVPNTTIESAKVNALADDIAADLNAARPITAGGTGEASKQAAIDGFFDGTTVVDDGDLRVSDPSDRTKIVRLDAGLVTTATTRVLTAPDRDINISSVPRGHLYGLTLSNNATDATNDIDIAAGEAASDDTNPHMIVLASALTKRLDAAWAVGTGNGGLDTGSIADTTYHVWLIQRSDTGVVDALFSASASSPTMPTNYDRKRRIGSIVRESAAIVTFRQNDDIFFRSDIVEYSSTSAVGSGTMTFTGVPAGVVVRPIFVSKIFGNGTANAAVAFGSHSWGSANFFVQSCGPNTQDRTTLDQFATNTSRQLYIQVSIAGGALTEYTVTTIGWVDDRGRLS